MFINQIIFDDFKKTNQCRLSLAKETFDFGYAVWAVAKKSRYYEMLNRGYEENHCFNISIFKTLLNISLIRLLELDSYGLLNYWRNQYIKKSVHCSNDHRQIFRPARKKRFTLSEFSSTFFLFGITLVVAFVVLLIELSVVASKRVIGVPFY